MSALGRIEYFVPNRAIFREHLEKYCTHLTAEARSELKEIFKLLSEEKKAPYQNQYDYGSLYEAVQFPKYADSKQDIQPGSASPARIFAAHEATLLERAQKRMTNEVYNRHLKEKRSESGNREMTETSMSQTPAFDLDDFDEAQRLEHPHQSHWKDEVQLDTSNMYDIDADTAASELEMPSGRHTGRRIFD